MLTNGCKHWSFKIPDKRTPNDNPEDTEGSQDKFPVHIPYMQRTSEVIPRVFRNHGVPSYHRPFNTLGSNLVRPKDKSDPLKKCGVVYCISICPQWKEEYVSATGQNLGTGLSKHFNKTNHETAVQIYTSQIGHVIPMKSCKINGQEENWSRRKTLQTLKTSSIDQPQPQPRQGGPPNFDQTSASDWEFYPSRDLMQLQGAHQESSHFTRKA